MSKITRRGYVPTDEKEFKNQNLYKLYKASDDLLYLLNRGYKIKGASTFVGNHYLLSERQRLALVRGISKYDDVIKRKAKEITNLSNIEVVHIDGFNTIITLEVALSNSLIIKLIGEFLLEHKIKKAIFYLDRPVSNSGRLKMKILEMFEGLELQIEVENIDNVDSVLKSKENVVSSDAIILDNCISWVNLNRNIIEEKLSNENCIDFSKK